MEVGVAAVVADHAGARRPFPEGGKGGPPIAFSLPTYVNGGWVGRSVRSRTDHTAMPTATLSRSDAFPVGTSVSIYPATARREGQPPTSSAIASGTVDAAGALSVTNAGILQGATYTAYASVNGEHRYVNVRSTLDVNDSGKGVGTANTTSGSAALASVSASSGAFAIGQRVTGPGIPAGTFLISGSGASWTMSDKATATATGVAIEGHGATPAVAGGAGGVGASLVDKNTSRWRARVMQRRAALGTS